MSAPLRGLMMLPCLTAGPYGTIMRCTPASDKGGNCQRSASLWSPVRPALFLCQAKCRMSAWCWVGNAVFAGFALLLLKRRCGALRFLVLRAAAVPVILARVASIASCTHPIVLIANFSSAAWLMRAATTSGGGAMSAALFFADLSARSLPWKSSAVKPRPFKSPRLRCAGIQRTVIPVRSASKL